MSSFRLSLLGVLACGATAGTALADSPPMTVRQIVIRVPKMPYVNAAMATTDDETLAKMLWDWVAEGKATVLSEMAARANGRFKLNLGDIVRLPTENDQDFDKALLTPTSWMDVFVGTSLEADLTPPTHLTTGTFYDINVASRYSPRDAEEVPWPVWWPPNRETKPNWYKQKDFFLETVTTASTLYSGRHRILAVVRCGDQLDPDPMRIEMLDVILIQVGRATGKVMPPPKKIEITPAQADPFAPTPGAIYAEPSVVRISVLTFGMKDRDAVALLARSGPHRDKEMLDHLLKESAAMRAPLRDFVLVNTRSGQRATAESARWYSYPTEMPTIPSAWAEYPSGTRLEVDPVIPGSANVAYEFNPVPPRRAEWRCALDTPELFMWQPQFMIRKIVTGLRIGEDGVALLGVMRSPDCHADVPGVIGNETLVIMARMDEVPPSKIDVPDFDRSHLEVEAVVFDVPESEAAAWPAPGEGPADDSERFAALLARVDGGKVKIAAHVAVGTSVESWQEVFGDDPEPSGDLFGEPHKVAAAELAMSVSETETNDSPFRYRPTAMYPKEIGTTLDAVGTIAGGSAEKPGDPFASDSPAAPRLEDAKQVGVRYTLRHDVAPLQEPDYRSMIALAQMEDGFNGPAGLEFEETWKGKATMHVGGTQFIGARTPPGDKMKGRLHLAFLRVRVLK